MKLVTTDSVDFALRTLTSAKARRIRKWFDQLKNWDNDANIRKLSHSLPYKDVFVLSTTDGMQIFFRKEADTIKILDIATQETIDQFAETE
jgi:hypothetical protein